MPNDIDKIWGDFTQLNKDFNWIPKYNLKDGLAKFISLLKL